MHGRADRPAVCVWRLPWRDATAAAVICAAPTGRPSVIGRLDMTISFDLTDDATRAALARPRGQAGKSLADRPDAGRAGAALVAAGIVPERQAKMRAQQLWHWLYVRGVSDFAADVQHLQGSARRARRAFHDRPAGDRRGADFDRRHPQMAVPLSAARRRPAGRDRDRLHSRGRPRHALHLQPGRLHADLLLLPHRHAEAGAQPDRRGNPHAADDGARPARRFPRPRHAGRRHRAGRRPQDLQHRHDGHGRAALQFRGGEEGAADRLRRRRAVAVEAPHHAVDLRRRARNLPHRRRDRRHAGDLAACRAATICATCWCRSTRSIR